MVQGRDVLSEILFLYEEISSGNLSDREVVCAHRRMRDLSRMIVDSVCPPSVPAPCPGLPNLVADNVLLGSIKTLMSKIDRYSQLETIQ